MRILPQDPGGPRFLTTARTIAADLGVDVRNPKWTSYGALEVDLFPRSKGDVELFLSALEPLGKLEFVKDLGEAPPHRSVKETVSDATSLFNSERYWESHEVLEGLWRVLTGRDKKYIQGVILVCAAFVHHQKGEDDVALGVLRRAEKLLHESGSEHFGIDPDHLSTEIERILKTTKIDTFEI
jgi:hypothetical protein